MQQDAPALTSDQTIPWQRIIAPTAIIALMAAGYALGLHKYLTLQSIAMHRDMIGEFTSAHQILALGGYILVYVAAVALSFPGAAVLTILGGLLFGWLVGGAATVIAATIGATLIFQVAKTSLGDALARKGGPLMTNIKDGFASDAFNYLLFLRLVPVFPFWLVNIAPAFAQVKLRTFVAATALGIVPGTFAFAFLGEGLDSIIAAQKRAHDACVASKNLAECPLELSVSSLVTRELLIAFAVLGFVALIPIAIKKWKGVR
jgi:uncharacterized membrane protein YdjX (TVP38/TMEM64 family)